MDKYGLIGCPLGHSLSRDFFNTKFRSEGINAEYVNYEIPNINSLKAILLTTPELRGLNVTIPYKQQIIPLLTDITPTAKEIGAVNVVSVRRKGKKILLKGYNSDVVGFTESIRPLLKHYHKKALILGTGGSSRAVSYGLRQLNVDYTLVSRTKKPNAITYEDVTPDLLNDYKVVVNCTPVGMHPNISDCPAIPYEALDNHSLLYDLVYNPEETTFLTLGKRHGAIVKNGLEMLLLQAITTWEFWNEP